jgi:2-polyprenyl-3-methyl-5-hydroxy-6-metoxy-1,4-benzoquinol methylase
MQPIARCYCHVSPQKVVEPVLLLRAISSAESVTPYLSVSAGGHELGGRAIPGYGTYYFRMPTAAVENGLGEAMALEFRTSFEAATQWSEAHPQVAIYEARIVDLEAGDFPDRAEFLDQTKVFRPEGGYFYEVVRDYPFDSGSRLLEVGAGKGALSCLMATFTGASIWAIDVVDYGNPRQRGFAADLLDRFRLHRSVLAHTPGLESAAEPVGLADAIAHTSLVTMSAEEMLFADSTFDFVFSLNVMEHIPHPDRALREIHRVLKPGRHALLQFSPLYYSDAGSHLYAAGYPRPWAHLLMTREEIKAACLREGANVNEVDGILASLNGWRPQQYYAAVQNSGLNVLFREVKTGFTYPGAAESEEFRQAKKVHSEEDLTTTGMIWLLEKPAT